MRINDEESAAITYYQIAITSQCQRLKKLEIGTAEGNNLSNAKFGDLRPTATGNQCHYGSWRMRPSLH